MINGTAAAALSALRLMIAGCLRIGLSIALASSKDAILLKYTPNRRFVSGKIVSHPFLKFSSKIYVFSFLQ